MRQGLHRALTHRPRPLSAFEDKDTQGLSLRLKEKQSQLVEPGNPEVTL